MDGLTYDSFEDILEATERIRRSHDETEARAERYRKALEEIADTPGHHCELADKAREALEEK